MNQELDQEDLRQLDRLVDGELSEPERRALLSRFDETPGAWRRCALAFLESQAWRQELGDVRAAVAASTSVSTASHDTSTARSGSGRAWSLALAASVLVAFGVGVLAGSWRGPANGVGAVEDLASGQSSATSRSERLSEAELRAMEDADPDALEWQTVELGLKNHPGDKATEVQVPVVEAQEVDSEWLNQQRPTMSTTLRQSLEQAGLRVLERPRILPITLKDGRRLVLPVDQVEVEYTGNQSF